MDSQRDLEEIAYCLSAHFRQTGDIALSGAWTPLGGSGNSFAGSFDGSGFDITGVSINLLSTNNVGLFSVVSGEITGGNMAGTVIGQEQTGGIAGWLNQGSIGNSTSAANVTGDYLMHIRGKGTGTRYVLVTVT